MTKRWALWGLLAVLSIAALISSLGTVFQTLPLNPDIAGDGADLSRHRPPWVETVTYALLTLAPSDRLG